MELRQLEEKILSENDFSQTRRDRLIENVLDLTVNSGKMDGNINYILYSENSKEEKKKKIKETEEYLKNIVKNIINIADSLEISLEDVLNK